MHTSFNPIARARAELKPYQSNIIVQTASGSEIHAQWNTCAFTDFEDGDVIDNVIDFWTDDRYPVGGFVNG